MSFRLFYPDVLGAIVGDNRLLTEELQFGVGIFPKQAFINQPVEVVIILQNMIGQNMQVKIGLQLPKTNKKSKALNLETPKTQLSIGLNPGEVGVVRMPIVALAPTPAGTGYPVRVAIRYRTQEKGPVVRPPDGGPPPSSIDISPFRLQVLQDVDFGSVMWNDSVDIVTIAFDVAAKSLGPPPQGLKARYESLWTAEKMEDERELVNLHMEDARLLATKMLGGSSYPDLLDAVEERFAARGLILHPGEAKAIAKMMTYTVDEAPNLEYNTRIENTRWFRALCQVMAHDESLLDMKRSWIFANYIFDAILFDSIGFAFKVVQPKVKEDLGAISERLNYANRLMMWIAGHGKPDLNYAYLPLILGGVVVNRLVIHDRNENPWDLLDELAEAQRGRLRLDISEATISVFDMLHEVIEDVENTLRSQRIRRN